jgi:hypothetical protein
MALELPEGFQYFDNHRCVTGSMRHVYGHNDHAISEEMLLGLGPGFDLQTLSAQAWLVRMLRWHETQANGH